MVTSENGLVTEEWTIILDNATSLESVNEADQSIKIYPNPVIDFCIVSSENVINTIELFDISGNRVITSIVNEKKYQIDRKNISSGIYLINVCTDNELVTKKISIL